MLQRQLIPHLLLALTISYALYVYITTRGMTDPPHSPDEITHIANALLEPTHLRVKSYSILQKLWAGYGNVCHVEAIPLDTSNGNKDVNNAGERRSFVLKHVTPPLHRNSEAQRDEGHLRKLISYQVEQHFYARLAAALPPDVVVAEAIGSVDGTADGGEGAIALMLGDLREKYPVAGEKRGQLDGGQVRAALRWLAGFHGFWWGRVGDVRAGGLRLPPLEEGEKQGRTGVWLNGGYTYLATRRKEYAALKADRDSEWSSALCDPIDNVTEESVAEFVARVLAPALTGTTLSAIADYETLIHGDVKSENLFANTSGSAVAFFDFQYVGLGLGVCDLAKLFTCSVPLDMLVDSDLSARGIEPLDMSTGERDLLQYYRQAISSTSGKEYPWRELEVHWNAALVDWLRFQASWGFWGNTEWLEARVRHILQDQDWLQWLKRTALTK